MMRKLLILAVIGLSLFAVGFSGKLPAPVEGVYSLKLKTLTIFDLSSKEINLYGNNAELTDSKPDFLEVTGIDYEKFSNVKFGSLRLGNNEKKVWFLMAQDSMGYWSSFYVDQNLDNTISKKEQVKSFQTSQNRERGYNKRAAFTLVPVPIRISYKGVTREYEKDLYFFIQTVASSKKNEYYVAAGVFSASFLEGELQTTTAKGQNPAKFWIIDGDSNGCFNDYGRDMLFINIKQDGIFHKNESEKLLEFFDSTGDENSTKQLRFNLLPFGLKLGVTEATGDFDLSQLEPQVEPETGEKSAPAQEPEAKSADQPKQDKGSASEAK